MLNYITVRIETTRKSEACLTLSFVYGGIRLAQANGKKQNTAAVCAQLAAPVAQQMGLEMWDVTFEKEGAGWYLRYLVDRPGGVDIDQCEDFSRQVSDLLDEADPIPQSYTLEVGSPGIERKLTQPWHFARYLGRPVVVRLIRPVEGEREFMGTLSAYDEDGTVTLLDGDEGDEEQLEMVFSPQEIAYVRVYEEF